jgi:transcriptional regulator with XRE-family HTH domain
MPSKKRRIAHAEIVQLFAARLKDRRQAAGLTQTALARRAHLTLSYVGRLEAAGAAPGIDTVARLADALGATVRDLLPLPTPPETAAAFKDRTRADLDYLLQKGDPDVARAVSLVLRQLAEAAKAGWPNPPLGFRLP